MMTASPLTQAAATRRALAGDPHRPRYHFLPPANWMNDPNGFIHWRGRYHLFYQYNPHGAFHGAIHWGHAASPDLVHWEDRPIALTPTVGGPDAGGCWSGSAVDAGAPTFFYSGVYPQTVCMARGDDDLDTWVKHPTPLIAAPPPGFGGDSADFRDPYVWCEGDEWYMVMGTRVQDDGGAVLLYRSADLRRWAYAGPLLVGGADDAAQGRPFGTGSVWECPNLFPLDGRHVLIVSYQDHARGDLLFPGYMVGEFDGERFTPGEPRILEYGGCHYAPQVTIDASGRAVLMGWLMEERDKAAQLTAGWSGVMSLPRVLSLGGDGTLRIRPVPELAQLRGEQFHLPPRILRPGNPNPLAGLPGDGVELDATLRPAGAMAFGLRLLEGDPTGGGRALLIIRVDAAAGTIALSRGHDGRSAREALEPAPLPAGSAMRLRVFLDRSVVEVFADERVVLSGRYYPARPDNLRLELFAEGGAVELEGLGVWRLASIWPTM